MKFKHIFLLILITILVSGCTIVSTLPDDWIAKPSNSLKTINVLDFVRDNGNLFEYNNYIVIPVNGSENFVIFTGNKSIHFRYYVDFETEGELILYENPTINISGIKLDVINSNRESTNNFTGNLYFNSTFITNGIILFDLIYNYNTFENNIILKKNTYYLIKLINLANVNNIANLKFEFYFYS